jgi:hypothetical protein
MIPVVFLDKINTFPGGKFLAEDIGFFIVPAVAQAGGQLDIVCNPVGCLAKRPERIDLGSAPVA